MANKPNDFFATLMFQPNTTFEDMAAEGLTADNLGLQSRDYYKNIQQVKDVFVGKDGQFDTKSYNAFYDNCLSLYNEYALQDYEKLALQNFEYNPDVWWAPRDSKKMNTDTQIVFGKNPMKINVGINYINSATDPTMSVREIAQANVARDSQTGASLGWTPNEKGGLFKSLSRPTLVLATWDEDGVHEEDGRMVQHKKGEYKFDEDGCPYYETLGNREIYDKDVLHYTDTFTTDGSKANKFDFFDSDGLDKSIGGTLMKTAVKTLPMLIPYVGPVLGTAGAALALSQLVPVLAKSINGLVSTNDNDFGKAMTKFEGYMARFDSSTSDYSRNKMVSMENLGSLVSSISHQLFQQKAIGMIPGLLGDPNNADHMKLGQKMALAYMAGTSAKENYGAFRSAGANEETAGLAMLASAFSLYGLMNSEYLGYKETIFKGSWLDESVSKAPALNVAKEWSTKFAKETAEAATENVTAKKNLFKWMQTAYTKHFKDALTKQTFIASSLNEGFEEVMEEGVADMVKAFAKGAEALGIKTSNTGNLNFGMTFENTLARYAMAFGGGTLGGALFQVHGKWDQMLHNEFLENTDIEDLSKLTYMIAEGRADEIRGYYRKWHKEGRLGSTNLGSKFETIESVKGKEIVSEAVRDGLSHNDVVFEALMGQVDLIEQILSEEQLKVNERTLGEILKMNGDARGMALADTFVKSGIMGSFLNEFNRLGTQIVKKRAELDRLVAEADVPGDTAASNEETKKAIKNNAEIKKLEEELKELRTQRDAILKGERNDYYMGQILFVMNDELNKHFVKLTKDNFAKAKYNKRYESLNDAEKDLLDDDYNDYIANEGKYDLYRAYDVYLGLSELWEPKLTEAAKSLEGYRVSKSFNGQYGSEYFKTIANAKKLQKTIDELEAKESLTPEEAEKLKESTEARDKLVQYLYQLESNPELATQQIISDETAKKFRLLGTDADNDSIFDEVAKTIEETYIKARDKKEVLFDDNDLTAFYSTFVKSKFGTGVDNKFRSFLDIILQTDTAPEMESIDELLSDENAYATDSANFFDRTGADQSQSDFIEQMNIFTKSLGKDNIAAVRAYHEAERILRENSTAPDELVKLIMDEMFGTINGESIIDYIQRVDSIRKDVKYHPFEDLFADFIISVNGTPSKLLEVLRSEEKRLALQENLLDYTIDNDFVKEELKEIGLMLNAFRGIIHGAFDGTNNRINPYRKNISKELLADFDEESAKILLEDAERLQMRIDTLLRINEASQSRKSKMQQKIACNMRPKFVKAILSEGFVKAVKDKFGDNVDLLKIWDSIEKPDGYTNIESINVNEQSYIEWETAFVEFETQVFDLFKSVFGRKIYELDFAKTFVELFGSDLSKMVTTRLTDDPEVTIESYDLMNYFASMISINASDFYAKYKEVIESKDFEFAPIFAQEMAVRELYSMALRPDLFNNIVELLKQNGNKDPYIANKSVLKNVMLTLAGAGTGKTTGIANIVVKMLDSDNTDFIALAPTKVQVDKLAQSIGKSTIPTYTRDDIFKFITNNPNGIEAKNIKFNESEMHFNPDGIKISDKLIFDPAKPIRILVVDEIACFNEVELKLLSEYAKKHDIFIIGLGDFKQTASKNEGTFKGETKMISNGIEDFVSLRTPSPTASLRASNVAKLDNYNIINSILESVEREYSLHPEWSSANIDAELSKYLSTPIDIKYHSEGKRIVGEKFVDSEDALRKEIERVKGLGSILIIADDTSKYSAIDGVTIRPSTNVNGGEFDYVFVDKKWSDHNDSKFDLMRDLYTVSQRSTQATIMIDYGITNDLVINSKNSPESNAPYVMSEKEKTKFREWRLGPLNRIVPTENFEENTSYYRLRNVGSKGTPPPPPPPATGGTPSGSPSSSSGQSTPSTPGPTNGGNAGQTPPPSAPSQVPGTQGPAAGIPPAPVNNPGSIIPQSNPESQQTVPPVSDPNSGIQSESAGTIEEEIQKQIVEKKAPMYLGDFYSTIYDGESPNPTFIAKEKSYQTSLYNFVNGRISDSDYVKLISLISAIVRRNEDLKENSSFNKIQRKFGPMTALFFADFQKHLKTYGYRLELRAISTSQSELYVVSGEDSHELRIYAGLVNSGKSGIYTGGFTQVRGPRYDKSNQTRRIKVSEIAGLYPGLHVGSQWGIITIKDTDLIPDDLVEFLENQNNVGKTQILCTDDPLYTDKELGGLFRTTMKLMPNGTPVQWAYADDHTVTLAGVQRALKPSEVLKYVVAMHAKRSFAKEDYLRKSAAMISGRDVSTLSETDLTNIVEDYIEATTISARHIIPPIDKKLFAQFFASLNHSQYHVLHDSGKFVAECFKNPDVRSKLIKNLTALINQQGSVVKSRKGIGPDGSVWYSTAMFVKVGNNEFEVQSSGGNTYTIIAPDGSQRTIHGNSLEYPFETITNEILYLAGATIDDLTSIQFKDYDLRPGTQSPGPWVWDQNELIYWMFYADGEAMTLSDADRLLPQHFYSQGYAGDRYANSFWSKHVSTQQDGNDAAHYTTTAVDWTYSVFVLEDSKIKTGSKQKLEKQTLEKDKFDGWREEVDEIAKDNGLIIPNFEYNPNVPTDMQIQEYVKLINHANRFGTDSWIFTEIVYSGSKFDVIKHNDVKNWLSNLLAPNFENPSNITIYDDFKDNGTWKYVNFSVTLSDGTLNHYIARFENGKWNAYEFNSAPEYNSTMQILKSDIMQRIPKEEQDIIKKYVLSIQTDNVSWDLANNYANVINSKADEVYNAVNTAIMNYLTKRLELNEC